MLNQLLLCFHVFVVVVFSFVFCAGAGAVVLPLCVLVSLAEILLRKNKMVNVEKEERRSGEVEFHSNLIFLANLT